MTPRAHSYTLSRGITPLRQAIARHYKRWYDLAIDPDQILITMGSSVGFLMAFLTCFDAGARIAMTVPGYSAYRNLMLSASLEPMLIDVYAEDDWRLSVEKLAALSPRPDGLLIANPANPTGVAVIGCRYSGDCEMVRGKWRAPHFR